MKDCSIVVRVSPSFKTAMENLAKENRRSLSDFLRIMMEDLIKEKTVK